LICFSPYKKYYKPIHHWRKVINHQQLKSPPKMINLSFKYAQASVVEIFIQDGTSGSSFVVQVDHFKGTWTPCQHMMKRTWSFFQSFKKNKPKKMV